MLNFTLNTKRLTLRPPIEGDVSELFDLMADARLTAFLTWEAHSSQETTKSVIQSLLAAQQNDKGYHWCVIFENKIIGLVSLIDVRRTIRTWTLNRAELSYWISPAYQGKGYATEASDAVLNFGFTHLNLHKIIIAHAADNIESASICKKLGFIKYGEEHDAFQKNNTWHDLIWYELIR